jgi:hypothetical protein
MVVRKHRFFPAVLNSTLTSSTAIVDDNVKLITATVGVAHGAEQKNNRRSEIDEQQ